MFAASSSLFRVLTAKVGVISSAYLKTQVIPAQLAATGEGWTILPGFVLPNPVKTVHSLLFQKRLGLLERRAVSEDHSRIQLRRSSRRVFWARRCIQGRWDKSVDRDGSKHLCSSRKKR